MEVELISELENRVYLFLQQCLPMSERCYLKKQSQFGKDRNERNVNNYKDLRGSLSVVDNENKANLFVLRTAFCVLRKGI